MNKILCIGLGKLGLIFSFILASKNNFIYGYDIDTKIKKNILFNKKNVEPKLNELVKNLIKILNLKKISKYLSLIQIVLL